jgi:hypothetical protein
MPGRSEGFRHFDPARRVEVAAVGTRIEPPPGNSQIVAYSEIIPRPNLMGGKLDNCREIRLSSTSGPCSCGLSSDKLNNGKLNYYRNVIDIAIIALLDCFRSEVRLASARLPKKSQNLIFLSGDFHQSLQGPFLFVFFHVCRRPPLPHSPPRRHPYLCAFQVVVAGLQTRQRDGRERGVSSRGQGGTRFSPLQSKSCPSPSTNTSTPTTPIPGAKPSAPLTNSPPIATRRIPNRRLPRRHQTHLPPLNRLHSSLALTTFGINTCKSV